MSDIFIGSGKLAGIGEYGVRDFNGGEIVK